jgi:triosephosphate isomerase
MRQLIAGNWKMNGESGALSTLLEIRKGVEARAPAADILVCPPATLLARARQAVADAFALGGQDCHPESSGAYTGDISAEMLRDSGASSVIVGHSERRRHHAESSALVAAKARGAWRAGLTAIICIGETELERNAGSAREVCSRHIAQSVPEAATADNTIVAYEPVWAIGTGRTPTSSEIAEMHGFIRECLAQLLRDEAEGIRILYGGSVTPANSTEILALENVGGVLVGGASLKAAQFLEILSHAVAG